MQNIPREDLHDAQQWLEAEAAKAACDCPQDYDTFLQRPDGSVYRERHNDWCPASTRFVGRLHWHDQACYAGGDRAHGALICSTITRRTPR